MILRIEADPDATEPTANGSIPQMLTLDGRRIAADLVVVMKMGESTVITLDGHRNWGVTRLYRGDMVVAVDWGFQGVPIRESKT
jgi:hypothetical protein